MSISTDSDSSPTNSSKGGKSYLIRRTINEYVRDLVENLDEMGGMTSVEIKGIVEGEMNSVSKFTRDVVRELKIPIH